MAAKPAKPFVRGGITFPTQYAYRQYLAQARGYSTPFQNRKAIAQAHRQIDRYLSEVPIEQKGVLASMIASYRGAAGVFREGTPIEQRGSNRLPRELVTMLRNLKDNGYPLWRLVYR